MIAYETNAQRRDRQLELVGRGVDVGEIFHFGESGQAPGPHPERADHGAFASFSDPDGNTWVLGGQPKRDGRVTRPVEPTDDIAAAIAAYERASPPSPSGNGASYTFTAAACSLRSTKPTSRTEGPYRL